MSSSSNNKKDETTEYFDSPEELHRKIETLAKWTKESKHIVVYTGSGISTSAGICDFRGPQGVWTLKEKGLKPQRGSSYHTTPTKTHMALSKMYHDGKIQYVTSQNVDGLHVKSGIARKDMSELHGNTNVELCHKCKTEYLRPFRCRNADHVHDHKTGRFCNKCGHELEDSIINFNENLPEDQLDRACDNAAKADLAIVLGTSLRVSPACDLPQMCKKKGGRMVIVNLQVTPKDKHADLRIFAKTDEVIELLTKKLGLAIPPFILRSEFTIQSEEKTVGKQKKVTLKVSSPSKGTKLLSSLNYIVYSGSETKPKITKYSNVDQIDDLPTDAVKVRIEFTFNLLPKNNVDAVCVVEINNPCKTSQKILIETDTDQNTCTY